MENLDLRSNFCLSLQQAAVEILGRQEVQNTFKAVLGTDYSGSSLISDPSVNLLADISSEFSIKYHLNTARGLLVRIGEAAFSKLRVRIDDLRALGSMENRLLPFDKKFAASLEVMIEVISCVVGVPFTLEVREENCYCVADSRRGEAALSRDLELYFIAGLLRAFGLWLDSRRVYRVEVEQHQGRNHAVSICLHVMPPQ